MRRFIFFAVLFSASLAFAQQGINYKALIKDANNAVVANQSITVQFTILQGVAQTNVYQETHTPTTDANGIIIVNIGEGTVDSGVFDDIAWASDDHFLNTQINTGSGLVDIGTTGFKTVPYALSAKTVETITETDPKVASATTNTIPKWDGTSLVDGSINDVDGDIGIGTTSPDPSAQLDVSSATKGLLPPRLTQTQINAMVDPAEGLIVYNKTIRKLNVYNGTEWVDMNGNPNPVPAIGDTYAGGIVFYLDGLGGGLVCAPTDQFIETSPGVFDYTFEWGCRGTLIAGANGQAIGDGAQNTAAIVAGCAQTDIAALICDTLTLNGYSDWYLPSRNELNEMYVQVYIGLGNISGMAAANYASSSQSGASLFWRRYFVNGAQLAFFKDAGDDRVRAIRSF